MGIKYLFTAETSLKDGGVEILLDGIIGILMQIVSTLSPLWAFISTIEKLTILLASDS